MMDSKPVWIWLPGRSEPLRCGTFSWRPGLGQFRYDDGYKSRLDAVAVDPQRLPLTRSMRAASEDRQHGVFGVIRDASPEGFGLEALESAAGRSIDNPLERLELAPGDAVGAIAVCEDIGRKSQLQTPSLDELLDALRSSPDGLAGGRTGAPTALGGERPKMTVRHRGQLWIAKLQARGDASNAPLREYLAMTIARRVGIAAAEVELHVAGDHQVLLVRRFDRHVTTDGSIHRRLFASAWTALHLDSDAIRGDPQRSYPKFADALQRWRGASDADIVPLKRELWRRMAFNAVCGNGDDHPRNHGLLHVDGQWTLAPAYDIAPPMTFSGTLSMAVTRDGQSGATRRVLLQDCEWFGLSSAEASAFIDRAVDAVRTFWRTELVTQGFEPNAVPAPNSVAANDEDRMPRQATTDADVEVQRRALTTAVRSCTAVVEYVDANLGIAEARVDSGRRVSITWNTTGIAVRTLTVGTRLRVSVTAYDFVVRAEVA
jgi:serine/threonine-protein kinase HipA